MMGKRAWNKSRGRESNRKVKYMFAVTPTDWKHEPSPHGRVGLALTGKVSLAMVLLWSKNVKLQAAICCFRETILAVGVHCSNGQSPTMVLVRGGILV